MTCEPLSVGRETEAPNKASVAAPDDYLAARLAYGAADALVKAHTRAAEPMLQHEAPAIRAAAARQLREALAALERAQ